MSTTRPDRFDRRCRMLYGAALALGGSFLILFPVWRGQNYRFITAAPPGTEGRWVKSGSFGLSGVATATNQAPIWAPPKAYSGIATAVRRPWEPFEPRVVEIERFMETTLLCGLVAGCGIGLRLAYRLAGRSPDRFVWSAWSTAAGLMLTGGAAWFALVLTLGMLLEGYENWLIAGMLAGGPLGWWYGQKSKRRPHADFAAAGESSRHQPVNALWRFTLGLFVGVGLWFIVVEGAAWFRGPIVGHNEFGFPRYARNQLPVNIGIGFAVGLTGWGVALAAWRYFRTRSFSAGVVASSTPLGIASCFW